MKKPGSLTFFLFAYWHDPLWSGFVGASVKIRDLADNLHRMGHRVVLYLPAYGFSISDFPFEIVEIPVIDRPGLRALSFNLFLLFHLMRVRWSDRPDVVYLRRTLMLVPLLYAKLARVRFYVEINDDPYCNPSTDGRDWKTFLRSGLSMRIDHMNMGVADRIFVISREVIEKIRKRRPEIPSGRFRIMPSGANLSLFAPMRREDALADSQLDRCTRYVGFAGTLLEHQGIGILISAADVIIEKCPDCRFVIMGEGPMKEVWRAMTQSRNLAQVFDFTGQIPYNVLSARINAMDVCVAPYAANAGYRSPVKIFDYLACAKPVVASRIKGTTDTFELSGAVMLVEPDQPAELAEAIVYLLQNPGKAELMGRKGRHWVAAHGSRMDMAIRIVEEAHEHSGRLK